MVENRNKDHKDPNENTKLTLLNLELYRDMEETSAVFLDQVGKITNAIEPDQQRGPSESP